MTSCVVSFRSLVEECRLEEIQIGRRPGAQMTCISHLPAPEVLATTRAIGVWLESPLRLVAPDQSVVRLDTIWGEQSGLLKDLGCLASPTLFVEARTISSPLVFITGALLPYGKVHAFTLS